MYSSDVFGDAFLQVASGFLFYDLPVMWLINDDTREHNSSHLEIINHKHHDEAPTAENLCE